MEATKVKGIAELGSQIVLGIPIPGLNRTPDRNPGSYSDTICLKYDRGRTFHESDPRYIVSDSDLSPLIPGNVM